MKRIKEIPIFIEIGSRPQGGVKNIKKGILSIGGEHIGLNGKLFLKNPKYVSLKFYESAKLGKITANDVLLCKDGALSGKVVMVDESFNQKAMINEHVFILKSDNKIIQKYIFYYLKSDTGQILLKSIVTGAAQGGINSTNLKNLKIPIPLIEVQKKIITEIEQLEQKEQKNIQIIEQKKKETELIVEEIFKINPKVKINEKLTFEYGKSLPKNKRVPGSYPVVGSNGINGWHNEYCVEKPVLIIGRKGSAGKVNLFNKNCWPIDTTFYVKLLNSQESIKFYYYILKYIELQIINLVRGAGVPGLNRSDIYKLNIPNVNHKIQTQIILRIEKPEAEIERLEKENSTLRDQIKEVLRRYL